MGITRLPFATVIVGTLLLTLSACGGQPLVFNGNPAANSSVAASSEDEASSDASESSTASSTSTASSSVSHSSTSTSTGSSSNSRSSSSSSRSSSVSSSSLSGPTGAQLYTSLNCNVCHGATGQGTILGDPLTVGAGCTVCANASSLANIITTTMPQTNVGACDTNCGIKIAAFIMGGFVTSSGQVNNLLLKQSASESASVATNSLLANTTSSCQVAYSANDLRSQSKREYSSAVLELTGIDIVNDLGQNTYDALPPDNLVTEFFNNVKITIDSDTQKSYDRVANKIADLLSSHNFNEIVDCSNASSEECYNRLVDGFGCQAFRRPLTTEERANYLSLYNSSATDGSKKVVEAILASPNFIYRSDIGLLLVKGASSALENAASLIDSTKTISIYQHNTLNANFTGNDVLEVVVKGTQGVSGLWPTMRVQVGDSTFVDIIINKTSETTYRFHITSLIGNNNITITNQQTGAPLEYQAGHNLIVSSAKLLGSD